MTETSKTARKTGGARKTQKRDAYDDFLDMVEEQSAPSGKKTTGKTAGVASRKLGNAAEGASKAARPSARNEACPGDLLTEQDELSGGSRSSAAGEKKAASGSARQRKAAPKRGGDSSAQPCKPVGKSNANSRSTAAKKPASGTAKRTTDRSSRTGKPSARKPRAGSAVLCVDNGSERDPFDDFLDAAEEEKPNRRPKKTANGLTAVLIVSILCVLGLACWQTVQYRTFLVMKNAVNQQTFYAGTTVEGVDVSGMTLGEALSYWEERVEPGYSGRTVTLSSGASFSAAELGYSSDYASVLTNAWSAGRSGSLEERYEAISSRSHQPVSYSVSRTLYTPEAVGACAGAVAEQVNRPAQNARIESFDTSTYQFTFTEESAGSELDTRKLAGDIARALDAGGGTVELAINEVQPTVKKADIASSYGLITSAVTNASSSSTNRLNNIRLALSLINGTCLGPGETFSFNDTVGKRTTERGFKVATAYSGGEVTEEVGGGICQVSTTLFNAAVKADLEIVERHNHSLTVSYVDLGKDASVNWSSQDLRFKNTSGDNIYICCFLDDSKRVRVGIFGKLLPNGESITVEGVTTGTISYETIMQPSLNIAPGTTQVKQNGRNGYTAEAYKIRWDANGNQISRELLCKSTYKSVSEIIEYGP